MQRLAVMAMQPVVRRSTTASLAAGRVSGDVRGVLAPDEALKRLLAGTSLAAQFVAENAFVLLLASAPHEQMAKTMSSADQRSTTGLFRKTY